MVENHQWTMTQVADLLGVSAHRLIHLCEKNAVIPDFQAAAGRGSSRRFSERNLLEFAVALELRELTLPVMPIAGILYVLREFEVRVSRQIRDFRLPHSLRTRGAPELKILIVDGRELFFTLKTRKGQQSVLGGIDFGKVAVLKQNQLPNFQKRLKRLKTTKTSESAAPRYTQFEVNVTQIARDLPLDP